MRNTAKPPRCILPADDIKSHEKPTGVTKQSSKLTPVSAHSAYANLWRNKRRNELEDQSPLERLLPSVSVALLITWVSLVFRLVEVVLFLPRFSTRPVPTETTHSSGVLGHKHLDSWMASDVGLLIRRPPSCPRSRGEKVFQGKS